MGTSQSSDGPGSGVPMVPPWTPPPPDGGVPEPDAVPSPPGAPPRPAGPLAPPARFRDTRRALGGFARSGDRGSLRRSAGHYIRTGYGGSRIATRRFGGTSATAAALGGVLERGEVPSAPPDRGVGEGRSARELIHAIVEAVRPVDGTIDAEASRAAIGDALAELLTRFPEADLLHLDPDQRGFVIERFTALDVCRRFELDLGKTITEKAPSATAALTRIKEVRDFIKETVSAAFRRLRDAGRTLTGARIAGIVRDALRDTFLVFEGYAD